MGGGEEDGACAGESEGAATGEVSGGAGGDELAAASAAEAAGGWEIGESADLVSATESRGRGEAAESEAGPPAESWDWERAAEARRSGRMRRRAARGNAGAGAR